MDVDCIFPALSFGEQILGRYKYAGCCSNVQTFVIITNYRLLIRRKYIMCFCSERSSYNSIALNSIYRVHEEPAGSSSRFFIVMLMLIILSFFWLIAGSAARDAGSIITAIILLVIFTVLLILRMYFATNYIISLQGTFGSERFELDPASARELEAYLLEMCYQRQLFPANQAPTTFAPQAQPQPGYQGKLYGSLNNVASA